MNDINIQKYSDLLTELLISYTPRLLLAILTLIIGLWLIRMFMKLFVRALEKRSINPSLHPFLRTVASVLLKVMLLISVLSMVGIEMTSFIALLGAAGLAIGMALSGTLQNFAGGVMILIFKPFKAGDYIEAQGHAGTVSEIQIFNTILKTPDNRTIIIPNGGLSTSSMVNYSTEPIRRVDLAFGSGYQDDIDKVKGILMQLIREDERILKEPGPFVAVGELADSSVNFTVRVWCDTAAYWDVHFNLIERVKKAFDREGISIPYPQTDVHLFQTRS